MELQRMAGESQLQYHKRLIYGKLIDKTLTDVDYAELSESVYGQLYSSDVARRMMYGSARTIALLEKDNAVCEPETGGLSDFDDKIIELQKERQRLSDQRAALNKLIRERSRQEELNDIIVSAINTGCLPELNYTPSEPYFSDNDLLISLNDIHYGANVKNYWNTYNSDVAVDMIKRYLDKILAIADRHGSQNCIVWANGDLISGNIHHSITVTNKENVIEQLVGVSELIANFLSELSRHFVSVKFVSVAGNHSRLEPKDMALRDERLDDLVEWYLAARLQNFDNIKIGGDEKIDSSVYLVDVRGNTYAGVHGDYDVSKEKMASLQALAGRKISAVLLGHIHENMTGSSQGVKIVRAGSFLGMDDLCVTRRIVSRPEQIVCVCDEDGIQCCYDVPLS